MIKSAKDTSMKMLIALLFITSCTHRKKTTEVIHPSLDSIKAHRRRYWTVSGAENILRKTSVATLAAWIKPAKSSVYPQDIISVSIGGKNARNQSRAALRVIPDGRLFSVARSRDNEKPQNAQTESVVVNGKWQHIALVIDYEKNEMHFYHNGKLLKTEGSFKFASRQTPDTPSHSVIIGAEDDASEFFFTGEIKHAGIWQKKFTEKEIAGLVTQFSNKLSLQ
jgi:hypothetical protein